MVQALQLSDPDRINAEVNAEAKTHTKDEWLIPLLREIAPGADVGAIVRERGGSYWSSAVAAGITTDDRILAALAAQAQMRVAPTLVSSDQACARIPERIARRYGVLPLRLSDATLEVATGNPYDFDCEQMLEFVASCRVRMSLASPTRIAERLDEVYRPTNVIERLLASTASAMVQEIHVDEYDVDDLDLADSARDRPIIKLVDHIVGHGIAVGASDVHLESEEGLIAVRYRIDGVLRQALVLPKAIGLPLVSRVKIMARLDIADRLRPQGGRALVMVGGERIDLRVSTLPAANGEKVVIRILDSRGSVHSLDSLGLDDRDTAQLHRLLETREGLLLVTGPTGSGKTTTLYAALQRLLDRGLNIITVEDPVEYRIPGIVQVQVNEKAGLGFVGALRSILRQDPDVILIGEIRDRETAAIAIQAALTGHLVFATLHTIDAASSIARMHDLGVEPLKVATALKGVIAQRLLRRTCRDCASPSNEPVPAALWGAIPSGAELRRGSGCKSCGDSGYRGRMAVIELLTLTPSLTRLVASAAPAAALCEAARAGGSRSLWASGIARVLNGETTAEEIARVLEPDASEDVECTPEFEDAVEVADTRASEEAYGDAYSIDEDADQNLRLLFRRERTSRDRMTDVKVGVVDVYVIDPHTSPWRALALQRGSHTRCPGSWEAVHGHIEDGEAPEDAAMREMGEETGLTIERLYNVTVHAFYLNKIGTVELAVVFCAFVDSTKPVRLGPEHQAYKWLPLEQAAECYIWPRGAQALGEITKLLGRGDAGAAEDVLRVK
ncbi:MAG: ATPase, T2SS/T4P/T4SS family [Gemmatimonadaceae bacterium]